MELKKTKNANLENKRGLFLQIGLVLTLATVFLAFEWRVDSCEADVFDTVQEVRIEDELIPVTTQELNTPPPPPPPAPKIADVIEIVDNDEEIEEDYDIEEDLVDLDEAVKIQVYADEEVDDEDTVFVVAEEMPEFPGGNIALFRWISKAIKYPVIAQENSISGRVYLNFVVNKQGCIENIKVTRGVDPSLDKEAIRVINKMPKWIPGKQRGKAVNVSFSVPINFQLQ